MSWLKPYVYLSFFGSKIRSKSTNFLLFHLSGHGRYFGLTFPSHEWRCWKRHSIQHWQKTCHLQIEDVARGSCHFEQVRHFLSPWIERLYDLLTNSTQFQIYNQIRPGIYEQILENEGLSAIRSWLEPLRDGSLPSIDIQRGLIDLLEKLPVQTDHLRSSGIGKIIYFYQKCGKAIPEIQRRAESLMSKFWNHLESCYWNGRIY